MIERFFELFERLVKAAERIAAPATIDAAVDAAQEKPKPRATRQPKPETPAPAPVTPAIERKDVSAALMAVAKRADLGPAAAFGILTAYKAKEVKELPASDYAAVVAECQKLLATPETVEQTEAALI